MKYLFYVMLFLNISCTPNGFVKYQSFDEYNLNGITEKQGIGSQSVYVKKKENTIEVIKSNDRRNVIHYVNKGDYWYSKTKHQLRKSNIYKSSTIPRYFEKFISEGVIMTYSYLVSDNNVIFDQDLYVDAPNNRVMIVLTDEVIYDGVDKFEKLRHIVQNYRQTIPYRAKYSGEYQPNYYRYYNKVWKNNCLFLYEKTDHDEYELGCLVDIIKLNSLGEFDIKKGKSIIKGTQIDQCE